MKKNFVLIIVLVCFSIILTACNGDSKKYQQALDLMDQSDYENAAIILSEIPDYEDASEKLEDTYYYMALNYLEKGDYSNAEKVLLENTFSSRKSDVTKTKELINEARENTYYYMALDYLEEGDYSNAERILLENTFSSRQVDVINTLEQIKYERKIHLLLADIKSKLQFGADEVGLSLSTDFVEIVNIEFINDKSDEIEFPSCIVTIRVPEIMDDDNMYLFYSMPDDATEYSAFTSSTNLNDGSVGSVIIRVVLENIEPSNIEFDIERVSRLFISGINIQ